MSVVHLVFEGHSGTVGADGPLIATRHRTPAWASAPHALWQSDREEERWRRDSLNRDRYRQKETDGNVR